MIEKFEQGQLPTEQEWNEHIDKLRTETLESTKKEVETALINAVKKRIPAEKFGLYLSGGVDSSILALIVKKFTNNFVCYSVGTKDSKDLQAAKKVAEHLKLNWKHKEYNTQEIEELIKRTTKIFDKPDVVNVGVGTVVIAATELAKKDGINTFFGGLGSEEIFAGYQRHSKAKNTNEECWKGLKEMWQRDLTRDAKLAEYLEIKVKIPFLDSDLIKKAMGIEGNKKINKEHRKIILREIAEEQGLPHEIAWRQKQAAQYGSGFDKTMEKLAKHKKMKKREYVLSLKI